MNEKRNVYFGPLKTPLDTGIKGLANKPADKLADRALGSERDVESDAPEKELRGGVVWGPEVEVEIRCDKPTQAEIKAVEDFFDWLLAEALRLAGGMGKAA
ncbi:MAG: hypothetical protein LC800_01610 [Acidobacteria bacterium]|nr:hypothetical protein [Acidobacteriota bacterium]